MTLMRIVEPFVVNSEFRTKAAFVHKLTFRDFYDIETFNHGSHSEGFATLDSWESFLDNAPTNAILIRKSIDRKAVKILWEARPGSNECWEINHENFKLPLKRGKLCYVKVVQAPVDPIGLPDSNVCVNLLGKIHPSKFTLVFEEWENWRPFAREANGITLFPASCAYSSNTSGLREYNYSLSASNYLKLSSCLRSDIEKYKSKYLTASSGPSYVSMMLRTEHVLFYIVKNIPNYDLHKEMLKCLNRTKALLEKEMVAQGTSGVYVTTDIGQFGSNSWNNQNHAWMHEVDYVKHAFEQIYNSKWTYQQWEKSFFDILGPHRTKDTWQHCRKEWRVMVLA